MAAKNDVTGDSIQTKVTNESYRSNYDKIFGKREEKEEKKQSDKRRT